MSKRLNIIVAPDEGGLSRAFSVSIFWLKSGIFGFCILLLVVIVGAVSYGILAERSLDYSRLQSDNTRLEAENKRIITVASEVNQSRKILAQIIRSLGGHLDLGRSIEGLDSAKITEALTSSDVNFNTDELLHGQSYAVERVMVYNMPTLMPVVGFITQKFHMDHLFPQKSHRGIDIAGKTGTSIVAAAAGRVVFEGWTQHFGNCIIITHKSGYITFYGHNQINLKKIGSTVNRNEPIALLGSSGRSSAPHLHFEIWKDGIAVDPFEFIPFEDIAKD